MSEQDETAIWRVATIYETENQGNGEVTIHLDQPPKYWSIRRVYLDDEGRRVSIFVADVHTSSNHANIMCEALAVYFGEPAEYEST